MNVEVVGLVGQVKEDEAGFSLIPPVHSYLSIRPFPSLLFMTLSKGKHFVLVRTYGREDP